MSNEDEISDVRREEMSAGLTVYSPAMDEINKLAETIEKMGLRLERLDQRLKNIEANIATKRIF